MAALPPSVEALSAWIGQDLDLDDPRAEAVLSAATALVRGYAGQEWADDTAPDDVAAIVVQVAARVYLSPPNSNVRNQTVGPFSEGYFDAAAQGLYLTDNERAVLNAYRTVPSGLGTLTLTREDPTLGTIYVPTGPPPAGYPFPWYDAADPFLYP